MRPHIIKALTDRSENNGLSAPGMDQAKTFEAMEYTTKLRREGIVVAGLH